MQDWSCTRRRSMASTNSTDSLGKQFNACEKYHFPKQKLQQQDEAASSSSSSDQSRPVRMLERYPSRLPDRTPVLPKRVINLRLEHYQQQHLASYIVESLQPFTTLNDCDHDPDYLVRGSSFYTAADRTTGGNEGDEMLYHISKPYNVRPPVRPPSPLGG